MTLSESLTTLSKTQVNSKKLRIKIPCHIPVRLIMSKTNRIYKKVQETLLNNARSGCILEEERGKGILMGWPGF